MSQFHIVKSEGQLEVFDKDKICRSLKNAGAPEDLANSVCHAVAQKVVPNMSTQKIFRTALRYLVRERMDIAARYSLERGLAILGPSGFPFERFLEAILQAYGYETKRNVIENGSCVWHEVDVKATKDGVTYIVEGKYRNERNGRIHLDQVMYADARLMDIERGARARGDDSRHVIWIMTNARFTENAIKYAECRGMHMTGWQYPIKKGKDLESLIVEKKLYPVTVLPSVSRTVGGQLAQKGLILAQDLVTYAPKDLARECMIPESTAGRIIKEALGLMQ